MPYFMLYVWDANPEDRRSGTYSPQFGDASRRVVDDERRDTYLKRPGYAYQGDGKYRGGDIHVERFDHEPTQAEVMLIAAALTNARTAGLTPADLRARPV